MTRTVMVLALMTMVGARMAPSPAAAAQDDRPSSVAQAEKDAEQKRVIPWAVESHYGFDQTVKLLIQSAQTNGLAILADIDEGARVSEPGGKPIGARTLLVDNPTNSARLLKAAPAAIVAVPTRISIFEDDGKTLVVYTPPSEYLKTFKNPEVAEQASIIDRNLTTMMAAVTK